MESITLKEISGYLPYDLEFEIQLFGINGHIKTVYEKIRLVDFDKMILGFEVLGQEMPLDGMLGDNIYKPLLYPLSMLTQQINHNGKEIIPIVELSKIKTQVTGGDIVEYYIKDETAVLRLKDQCLNEFVFKCFFEIDLEPNNVMFSMATETYKDDILTEERINLCGNEMQMFRNLYEWHFDVHGLIEKGLAIDKSKVNL